MAIILNKNGQKVYESQSGIVTQSEKKRADSIDLELKKNTKRLEEGWISSGLLSKTGVKKNTLKIWYDTGKMLNILIDKYKIRGSEEESYFWQSIYDHVSPLVQKSPRPQSYKDMHRNHFRLCAKMAERNWSEVQQVGNWSVWRDLFDNVKLMEDDRVFDWVVDTIRSLKLGHKELRPFIHAVRRRLKKIDTSILTANELKLKLGGIKPAI